MKIKNLYKIFWFLFLSFLTVIIGIVNYYTDLEVSFFYLIPISLASWYIGIEYSIIIMLFSTVTWFFTYYLNNPLETSIPYWNGILRSIVFLINAYTIYKLKVLLNKEKELGELKANFVSMVSHEFRTPLSAILAATGSLEYYYQQMTQDERKERLSIIVEEVKLMTQMLEEVLLIGKAESGNLEFNPEPVNLIDFCEETIKKVKLIFSTQPQILFTYKGNNSGIKVDKKLMSHIITNLLNNAVKYSSPEKMIFFEVSNDGISAIFIIKDEGLGIPEKDIKRLFEPFHRADNVSTIPGSGLGLSIVKRALVLHRGTIQVTSKINKGTKFTVTIPVLPEGK